MDITQFVRIIQCGANSAHNFQNPLGRKLTAACAHLFAQGHALDVVHDDKGCVTIAFEAVKAHNVGMLQTRQRPGFFAEMIQKRVIPRQGWIQNLDRQSRHARLIPGLIHNSHAAAAREFTQEVLILEDGIFEGGHNKSVLFNLWR